MTIDEAIEMYKKIANTDSNCPRYCMNPCEECVKECKQVAEWLEELKELRHMANELRNAGYKHGHSVGYNNAIDDLSNTLKENYDYLPQILSQEAFGAYIDEYAEQLKAGGKE